jgi:uncharacterized protein YndB with AHSA1/START domain
MENKPIIVERTYSAPISKVWKAITDKTEMKHWYFDIAEFKPEVGFKFQSIGGTETKKYLHLCEVTQVIPNKNLTYSWRYDGYGGISFVTFELFEANNKTRLKLTHRGLESFPNNPDFVRSNFEEGWQHLITISLPNYLVQ